MRRRLQGLIVRPEARWLAPLGAVLVLAIAFVWWRPWDGGDPSQSQLLPSVSTPTASLGPTATRAPERIALPEATPTRLAAPVATPVVVAATPAQTGTRAPGMLLYIGSLGGKRGIIAARADGSELRLVAEGRYEQIAWAPDGDRFAAVGMLDSGTYQVAIFTPEGRALGRYPFPGLVGRLLWSDGGGVLAVAISPFDQSQSGMSGLSEVWLLNVNQEPQRVAMPESQQAYPLAWTQGGRLHVASFETFGESFTLWLVGPDGRSISLSVSGPYWPIGFADDGDTAIVARIPTQIATPGAAGQALPTEILVIDLLTGARRTVAEAEALGQTIFVPRDGPVATVFTTALPAPDGNTLALVVSRSAAAGTSSFGAREESALVFLQLNGTVSGVIPVPTGELRGLAGWSPDGVLLATFTFGSVTNNYAIQIVGSGGTTLDSYSINGTAIGAAPAPAWSPDSRWLAYSGPEGLTIASRDGHPSYALDRSGEYPTWRP